MLNVIVPVVCCVLSMLFGLFVGIYDTKSTYGIPHKVPPEECEVIVHGRDDLDC